MRFTEDSPKSNDWDQQGLSLYRKGRVSFLSINGLSLRYHCNDDQTQDVTLYPSGKTVCSCQKNLCAHGVATRLQAEADGLWQQLTLKAQQELGEEMMALLARAMPTTETIRLHISLRLYDANRVGLGLSIGQERLYAVKSIPDFLRAHLQSEPFLLSPKCTYDPSTMHFVREDERLLTLLITHMNLNIQKDPPFEESIAPSFQTEGRFVLLSGAFLQSVMRYLESHPFYLITPEDKQPQNGIKTVKLPLSFGVSHSQSALVIHAQGMESILPITADARYVVHEGKAVHLSSVQARILLPLLQKGGTFTYPASTMEEIMPTLLPSLSIVGAVIPSPELDARLIQKPLKSVVHIDFINGDVIARLAFHYGDIILEPFSANQVPGDDILPVGKLLLRDGVAETELLDFFSDAGFLVRKGHILLHRSRDILTFCTQGVITLGKMAEVYASTAFEKVKPRRFAAKASFHMRNGRLVLSLLENEEVTPELMPVLQAIADRQNYVRLKSGEFLDLRDHVGLAPVVKELLEAAALDHAVMDDPRELAFGAYRATYLVSMLEMAGTEVHATNEVTTAIDALLNPQTEDDSFIPRRLFKKLNPYQQRGSAWLLSLYSARMGGVLADEMGLGKTVQVIAALSAAKRKEGTKKSMIITPTSLTYHWLAEFKRFDESLTVRLILGQREERQQQIRDIKQSGDVDVILTSYPLLRRDIADLKDIPLRFAVLDEAQSIKNAQSLGAISTKELTADVRIALTGTPMENHTGELWSIFDFVLPGYLGTQGSFLRRYGGGEHAPELSKRIRPFLMRRLKAEVLTNLPAKQEHFVYAAMTAEQTQIYRELMATLRLHVGNALEKGELSRARLQVLSLLLKLRQVCCHPKLFMSDYEGTSGKLELLVLTVHRAIANRRRMLIFSQFVGMLQMIKKRLAREGVNVLYLDGQTKPEMRQQLCDRFNGGERSVFLISLKAGGTGLNLTGADLVIHYDPWWNPATEDQATDRAHRIGQSKDVEVLKLIAQDSIEEKVSELSKRKRAIFDRVVHAGETELTSLSEEDIRTLFLN